MSMPMSMIMGAFTMNTKYYSRVVGSYNVKASMNITHSAIPVMVGIVMTK